ncbi:MAG: hypothetical protein U9Q81_11910 [Pseudomonadota bacterium]|nr:hypothetical protein [Pseudomonadota bacterium]
MHKTVTPGMEVQSLLSDGGTRQYERPERAVEGRPDRVLRDQPLLCPDVAEAQRQGGSNTQLIASDRSCKVEPKKVDMNPRRRRPDNLGQPISTALGNLARARVLGPGVLLPQQVPSLVEHGLQVTLTAVPQYEAPVNALFPGRIVNLRPGLLDQLDDRRAIEQPPKGVGNLNGECTPGVIVQTCS